MKIVVVVVVFNLAHLLNIISAKPTDSGNRKQQEEAIKGFIYCLRESLDGGNEEAGIPDHRSIKSKEIFTFPLGLIGDTDISLILKDIQYNNIPDFDVSTVEIIGNDVDNLSELRSNFTVVQRGITINAKYLATLNRTTNLKGKAIIAIGPLDILGSFDLNLKQPYVNSLRINLVENNVPKCSFDNLDKKYATQVGERIGLVIKKSFNELGGNTNIQNAIKDDINNNYLAKDKRYRLKAILRRCKSNYDFE